MSELRVAIVFFLEIVLFFSRRSSMRTQLSHSELALTRPRVTKEGRPSGVLVVVTLR